MTKLEVVTWLRKTGLIPVVRAESPEQAMRAVDAIKAGGVDIVEVTMTVPDAVGLIEKLAGKYAGEVLIGAGTVMNPETAQACIDAGAEFIVSPALNLETIAYCRSRDVAVLPGALTPTEVVQAWSAGADAVKVFPAGALGGASYLKSLKAPLPQIELVPTGGVSLKTAADFIHAGAMALGVGADLVDLKALKEDRDNVLTERAREYLAIVREARAAMNPK
ncbi:MAG TPA: bifunctional 4-hydroxy-2-oxoglutarate aldolase/2-dehydro-3-deoxy-phosphogluconate aldolase [Pyrinomonadaceae bacterium]|jgi:2-dehydro-3-deoxyphosphogluconate aldolase/(4S)-4-hydroxy-2-oxoglutarate aldolase|nr:bifunctional 4-hydroxy-2-oxoglutarate aldolase/2-dehydro-3-deoxy-phosphogluconate aldolase [Pyrinomonadaceae bacterium]